ncbi:hypothetical protein Hamer_G010135 [Homarus americanus]|uniref:Uncharacterized protein n=1 Tax=Homarus americanus TaxID=6706 RepID=A0A8J5K536_HOMAM|nr:hypothetical protein Hamer_G010135 [Homarus americanus]
MAPESRRRSHFHFSLVIFTFYSFTRKFLSYFLSVTGQNFLRYFVDDAPLNKFSSPLKTFRLLYAIPTETPRHATYAFLFFKEPSSKYRTLRYKHYNTASSEILTRDSRGSSGVLGRGPSSRRSAQK